MDKTEKDHLTRTRAILKTSIAAGNGWDINIHNDDAILGPQTYGYICDQPTGWVWAFATPRHEFAEVTKQSSILNDSIVKGIRGEFGKIIADCANGHPPKEREGLNWEMQLSGLFLAYAGTTKTWALANGLADGGHFVVLNYHKNNEVDSYLRPFAMPDTNNAQLSVEVLQERLQTVYALDTKNHPEWFV